MFYKDCNPSLTPKQRVNISNQLATIRRSEILPKLIDGDSINIEFKGKSRIKTDKEAKMDLEELGYIFK